VSVAGTEDDLDAARQLMARCSLSAIEYHELTARWTGPRPEEEQATGDVTLNLQHRLSDDNFGIRMTASVDLAYGEVTAVVAAVYEYEGEKPELRSVLSFANEVAVMTIFPYLREAISTITAKVFGEPFLLPILPRGSVGFDLHQVRGDTVSASD